MMPSKSKMDQKKELAWRTPERLYRRRKHKLVLFYPSNFCKKKKVTKKQTETTLENPKLKEAKKPPPKEAQESQKEPTTENTSTEVWMEASKD